jgi:hypothetical protein
MLRERNWGWLDRRGELHIEAPGLFVHDTSVTVDTPDADAGTRVPIRGRTGISVATALLLSPREPPGVREIARRSHLAPSGVSAAIQQMKDASLIRADGTPLVPELFWALSDVWHPKPVSVATLPSRDLVESQGWAVGSTLAALAWGAPVVVTADKAPDFYLADKNSLR